MEGSGRTELSKIEDEHVEICVHNNRTFHLATTIMTILQSLQPHEKLINIVLSKNPYILDSFPYKNCMHPSPSEAHYIYTRTHLRIARFFHSSPARRESWG